MPPAGPVPEFDTVILAGGAATRMGGADKPGLVVGGTAMVVKVALAAVAAGASRLIVVGPERPGVVQEGLKAAAGALADGVIAVREEPPGGGPVPALRCGLAQVTAPWLALLAADLPFLTGAQLSGLLAAGQGTVTEGAAEARTAAAGVAVAGPAVGGAVIGGASAGGASAAGAVGAVLADDSGRPQWLAGCWRAGVLRSSLAGYGGDSLRALLAPLRPVLVTAVAPAGPPPWLDCDTLEDLAVARAAAANGEL